MDTLEQDLQANREALALRTALRQRLAHCQTEQTEQAQRLARLKRRLDGQREDVEKLRGLSLTALFHTVLGDKKERLSEERKELLQAKLKHDECETVSERLEQDRAKLEERLAEFADLDAEREALLTRKEERLKTDGGETSRRLLELADEIGEARSTRLELREALAAGDLARGSLGEMIDCLGSAKNWGVYDMLGGGLIATSIKHGHIDKARAFAAEAQGDLLYFQNELADVDFHEDLSVEIGQFSTFADYFFDGLIFDWSVQSKIQSSLEATLRTNSQVEELLSWLRSESRATENRIEELEAQRSALIEQA